MSERTQTRSVRVTQFHLHVVYIKTRQVTHSITLVHVLGATGTLSEILFEIIKISKSEIKTNGMVITEYLCETTHRFHCNCICTRK